MDKVVLTAADVEQLLLWRDEHKEEVRNHPTPLKAVEIVFPHNGMRIKGIREGDKLHFHISQNYEQFGNCIFIRREDGMWLLKKNRTWGIIKENLQSVLTVYCTLMALMVYGGLEPQQGPESKTGGKQKTSRTKAKKRSTRNPANRTTYIFRQVNGTILTAPRGSHASPSGIFTVRGHYRHYKSGKVVWIAEYCKGIGIKKSKTYKMGGKNDERKTS